MKIVFAKPQKTFYKFLIALFLVGVALIARGEFKWQTQRHS